MRGPGTKLECFLIVSARYARATMNDSFGSKWDRVDKDLLFKMIVIAWLLQQIPQQVCFCTEYWIKDFLVDNPCVANHRVMPSHLLSLSNYH